MDAVAVSGLSVGGDFLKGWEVAYSSAFSKSCNLKT